MESRKRNLANKLDNKMVFGGFHDKRNRANKVDCIGKIPASVKAIAQDMTTIGDVRVEKEFDTDGTYRIDVTPRPVMVDLDLFYSAMKKNSIAGFFIDSNPTKNFFFNVTINE
jgi:hypothetical protein